MSDERKKKVEIDRKKGVIKIRGWKRKEKMQEDDEVI